jgi:hypothetical protein
MPEYLIFFNSEWVTEASDAGWQQRSRDVRDVVDEMKAAGVLIFTGGLDNDARVFHVKPVGGTPMFTDGASPRPRRSLAASRPSMFQTRHQPGIGRGGSRWLATGRRRCGSFERPRRFPPLTPTVRPQRRPMPMGPDPARPPRLASTKAGFFQFAQAQQSWAVFTQS